MFKKKKSAAGPSDDMTENITKRRRKGFGNKKMPHPTLGKKQVKFQKLGTPELNY